MNHLQDFQHGLTTMSTLLNEQRAVLDESQFARLRAIQCKSFCTKAKQLGTLDVSNVSVLTQQIRNGPWSGTEVAELVVAINEQMMAPQKHGKDDRPVQEIYHMENFFDQDRSSVIRNKDLSWTARNKAAVDMMAQMGLVSASEQSKARIFAVLMAAHGIDGLSSGMGVQEIRNAYVEFSRLVQKRFKNGRTPGSMGYIVEWPDEPAHLSTSTYSIIYGTAPPVKLELAQEVIKRCKDEIVMRGNATVLRQTSSETIVQVGNTAPNPQVQVMQMMNMMQQQMQQMQQHQHHSHHRTPAEVPITFLHGPHQQAPPPQQLGMQQLHERPPPLHLQDDSQNSATSPASAPGGTLPALMDMSETSPLKPDIETNPKTSPAQQAEDFLASLKDDKIKNKGKAKAKAEPKGKAKTNVVQAKGKSKAKAKAATKAKAAAKSATGKCKTPVAGWSDQRRLKEYPKGCPKCRGAIGCTPSCFKARGQT